MTHRAFSCRQSAWLPITFAFCLLPFGFCLPEGQAQQPSRGYEGAFRYPRIVPAWIENLAEVQWRERTFGVPAPEEDPDAMANPTIDPRAARLMPGLKLPNVTVPTIDGRSSRSVFLPLLAGSPPTSPLPDLKADTIAYDFSFPPDSGVAAGPTHLVAAANRRILVRTLTGPLLSTTALSNFFPQDATRNEFDPRLVFDTSSGRFIFAAVGNKSSTPQASTCVIAVSATSDPTGVWYKYVLDVGRGGSPPKEWADYPTLGYDGTAIYVAFNMFTFSPGNFTGNRLLIIDKSQALSGQALAGPVIIDNVTLPSPPFQAGSSAGTLRPVEAAEPVSPGLMISGAGLVGLALYQITDPLGKSGGPSINSSFIAITPFATAGVAPQAGTMTGLESGDTRLQKSVLRNGVIWTTHSVSSTGADGGKPQVNLYKVATTGALLDAKAIVDNTLSLFYPSVMPNAFGDATLVFSASSPGSFASIYSARYEGATGLIDTPVPIDAGISPYVLLDGSRNRWGDYTDVALDVISGTHVWTHAEIPLAIDLWQMRTAHIATSPPPPPGSLSAVAASPNEVDLTWTDNGFEESGFKIERKGAADADFSLLATVGPGITKYADTSVSPGSSYTYRVRASNGAGDSAPSNEAPVMTPGQTIGVSAVVLAPNPVKGGSPVVGIVALTGPAAGDTTVALASSNASIANPTTSSLVIPAGSTSQSFMVNTTAVSGSPATVTITATLNGVSASATLTVR